MSMDWDRYWNVTVTTGGGRLMTVTGEVLMDGQQSNVLQSVRHAQSTDLRSITNRKQGAVHVNARGDNQVLCSSARRTHAREVGMETTGGLKIKLAVRWGVERT